MKIVCAWWYINGYVAVVLWHSLIAIDRYPAFRYHELSPRSHRIIIHYL